MMVLFFAPAAFDVPARDEPGMVLQIDILPFGLKQLTDLA